MNLVFAELDNGVSMNMLEDKQIHLVSDGTVYLITTQHHSRKYNNLQFEKVQPDEIPIYDGLQEFVSRVCGE